jgi:hypothetical protein
MLAELEKGITFALCQFLEIEDSWEKATALSTSSTFGWEPILGEEILPKGYPGLLAEPLANFYPLLVN